jgi:hypothetical protein
MCSNGGDVQRHWFQSNVQWDGRRGRGVCSRKQQRGRGRRLRFRVGQVLRARVSCVRQRRVWGRLWRDMRREGRLLRTWALPWGLGNVRMLRWLQRSKMRDKRHHICGWFTERQWGTGGQQRDVCEWVRKRHRFCRRRLLPRLGGTQLQRVQGLERRRLGQRIGRQRLWRVERRRLGQRIIALQHHQLQYDGQREHILLHGIHVALLSRRLHRAHLRALRERCVHRRVPGGLFCGGHMLGARKMQGLVRQLHMFSGLDRSRL